MEQIMNIVCLAAARGRQPADGESAAGKPSSPVPNARLGGDGAPPVRLLRAEAVAAASVAKRRAQLPGEPIDGETVIYRLEEAGATLLALPASGYSTGMRTTKFEIVQAAMAYQGQPGRLRPAAPDAAHISRMDEALDWIPLIPLERHMLRRIVGCRSLVSPTTERHLFSWRRLALAMGADHKAVQRWHAQGIGMIVAGLNLHRKK
jgi:hypothetical protein